MPRAEIQIDRRDPRRGYHHLITVAELRAFVAALPDWDDVVVGLRAIVLDAGEDDLMASHSRGVVAGCAWQQGLWTDTIPNFVAEHRDLFDLLAVDYERRHKYLEVRSTEAQARAFQLLTS